MVDDAGRDLPNNESHRMRQRTPEIHYYEFSVIRWLTSDTRDALDATGIGVYRELMDRCYTKGSIPIGHSALAKIAKATSEEFERVWPLISDNFFADPKRAYELRNKHADLWRKEFFSSKKRSRDNGNGHKRKSGEVNPNENNENGTPRLPASHLSKGKESKGKKNTEKDLPIGWLETFFEEFWALLPAKGRINRPDAERRLLEYYSPIHPEGRAAEHARILGLIRSRWQNSAKWRDGVVTGAAEFIRNHKWNEEPEQVPASTEREYRSVREMREAEEREGRA